MFPLPWEQTDAYIRSGHKSVEEFDPESIRTIWISRKRGIKAIIGKRRGETDGEMEIISYLFALEKGWTLEKAKKWFEAHVSDVDAASKEHFYCLMPILERMMEKPLRIRGVALTAGISRNLNIYLEKELEDFAEKLVGAPVYLEHVSALNAIGKVVNAEWNREARAVFYEAEIYDEEVADKIRKGLIRHVSVAADYQRVDRINGKIPHGLHNAELSLVAVPGIPSTSIQIVEKLDSESNLRIGEIQKALQSLAKRVKVLEAENKRVIEKTHEKSVRAVVAPEALETASVSVDLSKVSLRDVMKNLR